MDFEGVEKNRWSPDATSPEGTGQSVAQDAVLGMEFLHFQSLGVGRRTLDTLFLASCMLDRCQPRTSVRGSGFSNPRERFILQ
jgi:hypothetical protein